MKAYLSTVGLACSMQSDDFMSEDVVTGSERRWYSKGPRDVVGNESIGSKVSWVGAAKPSTSSNLVELQVGLGDCCAITIAVGEVVDNWALVGNWPCIPLNGQL